MTHVILGLLLILPQSLYDIVKSFETRGSLLYSASSGSIKRALDGLLREECIEIASAEPGARGRKVYRVTERGRDTFHTWMLADLTEGDAESAALHRFFFLGLIRPVDRITILRNIVRRMENELNKFTSLQDQVAAVEIAREHSEIAAYQIATLELGREAQNRTLEWFKERLKHEERQ